MKLPYHRKKYERGTCYEASWKVQRLNPSWDLVHGICVGTGGEALGLSYGHAWLEKDGYYYDVIKEMLIPVDLAYAVGQIDFVVKYSAAEAFDNFYDQGRYGPWDKVIESAAHR